MWDLLHSSACCIFQTKLNDEMIAIGLKIADI